MSKKIKNIVFIVSSLAVFVAILIIISSIFALICKTDYSADEEDQTQTASVVTIPSYPYGEGFASDLSDYEEYINPIGKNKNAFLVLANKDTKLSTKYSPSELTEVSHPLAKSGVLLSKYAAKALEAMLIEMTELKINTLNPQSGLNLSVISGYDNSDLYSDKATGLSVIIHNCNVADISFASTDAGKWIAENCYKFGFIIRYPQGKAKETGVTYSPWQLRYVGRYHAQKMNSEDLCLEEYIEKYNFK